MRTDGFPFNSVQQHQKNIKMQRNEPAKAKRLEQAGREGSDAAVRLFYSVDQCGVAEGVEALPFQSQPLQQVLCQIAGEVLHLSSDGRKISVRRYGPLARDRV